MDSGNPEHNQQTTPLSGLAQLTDEDRATLAVKNITTVEEFFARQVQDPKLIQHLGLPDWKAMKRLAAALEYAVTQRWQVLPQANQALAAAAALNRRRLRIHWADITVGVVLLLSVGAYRGCLVRTAPVAPHGLMPFQLIRESDINLSGHGRNPSAALNEITGKYSTVRVPPGGEISPVSLSSRPLPANALDDRRILRLALQPSPLVDALKSTLPAKVSLMIAPKDKDSKVVLLDGVYILDVHTEAEAISAVVAVTELDAEALASSEARSNLIIVGPIR